MNNRIISAGNGILLYAVLFCLSVISPAFAQDAPKRVTIRLPDNIEMSFCAVYLGIQGENLFDSRRIKLGSREPGKQNYKEQLTDTLISGSFVGSRNNKKDWLYYLGETEVRKDQWNAVMRWHDKENGVEQKSGDDSKFPQTGVTVAEIYTFIEALNTWMLNHENNRLPKYRNAAAFCRLPTEAEWEFAARGGIEVSPDVFDRQYPYVDNNGSEYPGSHEWYRSTSGNRIQECGSSHIKPNPIGLYDMLGNAEELTLSLFGPEYQQGRFGQFVIRGGNFSTDESGLSASYRTEYQSHQEKEGKILRPPKVGFRLALATRITSSGYLPDELDKEYKNYADCKGLTHPGPSGKSSPGSQADQDMLHSQKDQQARLLSENERLSKEIERLEAANEDTQATLFSLKKDKENLLEKLSLAKKELDDMKGMVVSPAKQSNEDFLKAQLKQLKARTSELEQQLRDRQTMVFIDDRSMSRLKEQLTTKEQENADLKRQIANFDHEIAKDAARVRSVEKRYLEALMRQASANAYFGYRDLKKLELLKDRMTPKDAEIKLKEGTQMIYDYWNLVVQIVDETQADLLPEVKADLAAWLQEREKKDVSVFQRKALDLLERHVSDVRNGRYHRPEDLVKSFPNEPEFN